MNNMFSYQKATVIIAICLFSQPALAQSSSSNPGLLFYALVGSGLIILIGILISISDNLVQIEARESGVDLEKDNYSVIPKIGELLGSANPTYTSGAKVHKFKKGFDINIAGEADGVIDNNLKATRFAVRPVNFRGISPIPRMEVAEGDEVVAGDVLFCDKKDPTIKFVAPVSGEIVEVRRGAKRAITDVIILADKEIKHKTFSAPTIGEASREDLMAYLASTGGLALINQRPFDELPSLTTVPENVFISTFSTAPLAADQNLLIEGKETAFQKGVDVLAALTSGSVHLGLNAKSDAPPAVFSKASNAKLHWFNGPHPAGNVGVQMHHAAPIGKAGKVWTLTPQDVATIGELFLSGKYDGSRKVALTGSSLKNKKYVETYIGANVGELLKDNLVEDNVRIIRGDVLTGAQATTDDFLNANDSQISAIPEGNEYEMFGWLLPLKPRPSISKTIPTFGDLKYEANTNTHGEKRAFVVTGQYESVLPMDVYPQHLFKAIMAGDFEAMEGLGINELSEEDVALCEFACTSKMPLQSILRDGLDMMREQG